MPYTSGKIAGVSADPLPWVHRASGERSATRFNGWTEYEPRSAYGISTNPVLAAFRRHVETLGDAAPLADVAREWLNHFGYYWRNTRRPNEIARVGHRAHAKRVLERIVSHG